MFLMQFVSNELTVYAVQQTNLKNKEKPSRLERERPRLQ